MEKIDLKNLVDKISEDLSLQVISGRVLLDRLSVINEDSRRTAAYPDHRYAPFYYYLGKYFKAESVLEMGFSLGLLSASYFTSNKVGKKFFGYREPSSSFVSLRIGKSNIKKRFKGDTDFCISGLYDEEFSQKIESCKWDLIFINEEFSYDKHLEYFDLAWDNISENGLLVIEHLGRHEPAKRAFDSFCGSKNREFFVVETRYKTGIIQK